MTTPVAVAVEAQSLPWFCVHTSDAQTAHHNLTDQSFPVFWPRYWALDKAGTPVAKSLFGPYLFVAFDRADRTWRTIPSTRGVRRLISLHADYPLEVPRIALQPFIDAYGPVGLYPYQPPVPPAPRKPQWRKLWEVDLGAAPALG